MTCADAEDVAIPLRGFLSFIESIPMTGRIPHHLDLVLLRRDSDTNAWITASIDEADGPTEARAARTDAGFTAAQSDGAAVGAVGRSRTAPVRYEIFARFSCTSYGLHDRDPRPGVAARVASEFAAPDRSFHGPSSPATVDTLAQPGAFEDRLHIDVARGSSVNVALVCVEGLDHLEPLGDSGLDALADLCAGRIARLAGAENATRVGDGAYLVRIPRGALSASLFRAALRESFAQPFAAIGFLPEISLSVGMAVAPRDGITLTALTLCAQQRSHIFKPREEALRRGDGTSAADRARIPSAP